MAVYLGAGGLPQGQVVVNSAVSTVAQICSGISKQVLEKIARSPECLKTSETFLKAVLRHYKLNATVPNKQLLLHTRAKLYYRMGRLLQNWPQTEVRTYVRPYIHAYVSFEATSASYSLYARSRDANTRDTCVIVRMCCVCTYVCVSVAWDVTLVLDNPWR